MIKKVLLFLLILLLVVFLSFFQKNPLYPKQYQSGCPYYRDLLGRFFLKWEIGKLFIVGSSKVTVWHEEQEVNTKAFRVIQKADKCLASDDNYLFYDILSIQGPDTKSWEYIGDDYSKDKYNVYLRSVKFEDADPVTFSILYPSECSDTGHYSKDKDTVWFGHTKIERADPNTFEVYCKDNTLYGKDNKSIYKDGIVLR